MKTLVEVKEIINEEYSIIDLSNKLQSLGFEDICEFGNWEEIIESGNVVVAVEDEWENQILIDFDVVCKNDDIEKSIIEITEISEF